MGVENKGGMEKSISRRGALIRIGLATAGGAVAFYSIDRLLQRKQASQPGVILTKETTPNTLIAATDEPTPAETDTSTPSPTPTETEILKTPTPDFSEFDKSNWEKIQGAESKSTVSFENPAITYIIKLPRPGPDAFFGIIKVQRQDNKFEYVIAENFDCEHQELLQKGLLKEPIDIPVIPFGSGVWPVEGRPLTRLDADVFLEYAAGTIPWLISKSFIIKGEPETIICPKTFSLPKAIGETIVETTKPIIEKVINFIEENIE